MLRFILSLGLVGLLGCGDVVSGECMPNQPTNIRNTLWGRTAQLPPAVSAANAFPQTILVQAATDCPMAIGVQCSIARPAGNGAAALGRVTIIAEWGSNGAQNTAEIDMGVGVSFTVFGDYLRIIARNESGLSPFVSATAAPGTSGTGSLSPKRAINVGGIGPDAISPFLPIPQFASTFKFGQVQPLGPQEIRVQFYEGGQLLYTFTVSAVNNPLAVFIPVAIATEFRIYNPGPLAILNSWAIFGLDL
jgi:hypothetical protein